MLESKSKIFHRASLLLAMVLSLFSVSILTSCQKSEKLPNILFIFADDLGYGDVGCYNPESRIPTPNLNNLADEGIRFTDAHSPATVCTPSRYSLLTGRMAFRAGVTGVFTGAGGPSLIEEGRLTLPQMLKNQGYATAAFGKWHIGLTFYDKEGRPINENGLEAVLAPSRTDPCIAALTGFSVRPVAPPRIGFMLILMATGSRSLPPVSWTEVPYPSIPIPRTIVPA